MGRDRSDEGPAWFAATRYGYGSGWPIAWQGWAVLIVYLLLAKGATLLASRSLLAFFSLLIASTAGLLFICSRTTRGGWRWRWGDEDQ